MYKNSRNRGSLNLVVIAVALCLLALFFMFVIADEAGGEEANCEPIGLAAWCSLTFQARISEVAWAGTVHAGTHEWLELEVTAGVMQEPLHLISIRESGTTTITLPATNRAIAAGELALYIRTNDANLPHVTADAVYTGALVDTNIYGLRLQTLAGVVLDEIDMPDGKWPAGGNNPRASMQLVNGQWYTSNDGQTVDAGGNLVLGTPGKPNVLPSNQPEYCTIGQWPHNYSWEFGFDADWRPLVTISYTSWSGGQYPELVSGPAYVTWDGGPLWAWGLPGEEPQPHLDLSVQCRQNMMDLLGYAEARLNGDTTQDQAGHDLELDSWLDALRAFQRSGLSVNYLPLIVGE